MTPRTYRAFDPSPTGRPRRLFEPEEATMSHVVKRRTVQTLIASGAVVVITAITAIVSRLEALAARKWS